jgi:hypothetical protein
MPTTSLQSDIPTKLTVVGRVRLHSEVSDVRRVLFAQIPRIEDVNYVDEYNLVTREILDSNVLLNTTAFVGPSLCCGVDGFFLNDVLNAGYLSEENSPHKDIRVENLARDEVVFVNVIGNTPSLWPVIVSPPVVAEYAQKILGTSLRGLVVGNEPDL